MRRMTGIWVLVACLFLNLPSPGAESPPGTDDEQANDEVPGDAADGPDGNDKADDDADEQEADKQDRDEAIRAAWAEIFAPPEEHRWELEAGLGLNQWQTAYGGRQQRRYGRMRLRRLWLDLLSTSMAVDFARHAPQAGPLEFTAQRAALTTAIGVHWWADRWLLGVDIEGGVLWNRRTIGNDVASHQFKPLVGAAARLGVSVYGTASLSVEYGQRWHPERLDRLAILQLGWLL